MNNISSVYHNEPNMVALCLASDPKNKVLVYKHAKINYCFFRKRLLEHRVSTNPFAGNRVVVQLKRLRESDEAPERNVIVVDDCQGGYLIRDAHRRRRKWKTRWDV
jgi:hypothetical protein